MDWAQLGAILTAVAIGAWGVIKANMAETKAKTAIAKSSVAEANASAASVEILGPRNDSPSLYDMVSTLRSSLSEIAILFRDHKADMDAQLSRLRADYRALREELGARIATLEVSVNDHHLLEQRLTAIELKQRTLLAGELPK